MNVIVENISKSEPNPSNKNDIVYYARIMTSIGIFDVYDLKVRTVADTYFVGMEKRDKKTYLLPYSAIGEYVFIERKDAVDKAIVAEENAPRISKETYYEEY